MARLSLSFKTPNSLNIFSMKAPPSSSLSSMKLKTPFQAFIFSHMYRITRVFAKAKSLLLELLEDIHLVEIPILKKNKNIIFMNKHNKKLSFRLHYNWCASHHVMPLSQEPYSNSHIYYDPSWNTTLNCHDHGQDQTFMESDELARYLEWLEDKKNIQESSCCNEIDKLADLFIANCHEKFRLEKQESYRRFQEMMARSV